MSDVARWPEVSAALDALLDLDGAARERELRRIAARDASLAAELRALLAADRDSGLLDAGVAAAAPELMQRLAQPAGEETIELPGRSIGRWRLLRELGRGGMGEVWLAERDEGDFVQQAAVKRLKRGMDSVEVLRRFAQERRILATLNHPNIARLLDGGLDDHGRPFYAMELVEGEAIVDHARRHGLNVRERLQLMQRVCQAVGYAQARLVVHRDLKPSNILVDARGEPRLLDFGIAKILSDSGDAMLTGTGMRVLSPAYAAPEQILGEPVTTATDVYALGVLLFELLTGRLPHRRGGLLAEANAEALARATTERPSQALRRLTANEVERAYGARAAERERLARELSGDLDRIVLTALRREPERRYASAARLADDLRLYLDGRPIMARPDTSGYRLRKFVKRHRVGALATVSVLVSLVAGLGLALWQAGEARRHAADAQAQAERAEREARRAESQARRAEQTKNFVVSLFEQTNPERNRKGAELTAVDLLREAAGRVERELAEAPESQAELRVAVGDSLVALGAVDDGVSMVEAGVRQMREAGRRDELYATSLHQLAMKYEVVGRIEDAARATAEALELLDRLPGEHGLARISARTTLAKLAGLKGDLAGAERLFRQNLDERRALLGLDDARLAVDWNNLASIALRRDRYADAERGYAEASRVMALDPQSPASRQAWLKSGRGFALMGLGNFAGAQREMREANALAERTLHARHPIIGASCLGLSAIARYQGRFDAAAEEAARAVAIFADTGHPDQGLAELQLGLARLGQDRIAEARALLPAAVRHLSERRNREDAHYWLGRAALGYAMVRSGEAEGAAALDEAVEVLERPERARGNPYTEALGLEAQAALAQGDADAARHWREREVAALAAVFGEAHPRTRAARRLLRRAQQAS
jgi:serine/threonine protein kinase